MSLRRYSIYDAANIDADLVLEQGDVVVTTVTSGLSVSNTVRGTVGQTEDAHTVEFIIYGDATTIANKVAIGIGTADLSLTNYVGGDNNSIGYRVGEGQIHRNGTSVQSVQTGAIGSVVGLRVLMTSSSVLVAWFLNGVLLYEYEIAGSPEPLLDSTLFWFVSLGSTSAAADIKVFVNSGRQQFEYPVSEDDTGWWEAVSLAGALRVSDVPYVSHPSDTVPSTRWDGVVQSGDLYIDRAVNFWPWSTSSNSRGSVLSFTCSDDTGMFDDMLVGQYRDQPVELRITDGQSSYDDSTLLGKFVVESIEVSDELTRRITCRDTLAQLEVPLQRRYYRPDFAEGVAFRPWQTVIGACFSVPLTLIDEIEYRYAIDSVGVVQLGRVRDAGDPFFNTASPTDYILEDGGQVLRLSSVPFGIITVDASLAAGASYTPPLATDVLNGIANPFTDNLVAGEPDNWELANSRGIDDPYEVISLGPDKVLAFSNYTSAFVYLVAKETASPAAFSEVKLYAGVQYLITMTVSINQYPELTTLKRELGVFASANFWGRILVAREAGTHTAYYTPSFTHSVYIGYYADNIEDGLYGSYMSELTIKEVPPEPTEEDDEELEEILNPLPLENIVTEMMRRGGLENVSYSTTDLAAIDTATGYSGSGYFADEQVTVRSAIDSVLTGYTASVYLDRSGTLRFLRLTAPEAAAHTHSLDVSDMISAPLPTWDKAEGLTRRMGVRRNERVLTDADLVTDEVDVTLRLRRKLSQRHRIQVAYGGPLAAGYEAADAAEPLDSRLVKRADGQAEINRVGALYAVPRAFYTVVVANRKDIEIGDVVRVTYPRFGLSEGRNLLVVRIRESTLDNTQTLTMWGAYS